MKPSPRFGQPKQGERTDMVCPVCGSPVLEQTPGGGSSARGARRFVCSKRGCPWLRSAPGRA